MIVGHPAIGAATAFAVCRVLGVDPGWVAPLAGAVLGAAPDLPKWFGRDDLYSFFHGSSRLSLIIQWILLPMALHTQVFDRLIHPPVLPEPGANVWFDVNVRLWWFVAKRRDVYWSMGEALCLAIAAAVWFALL
jgi:hypothetical protein